MSSPSKPSTQQINAANKWTANINKAYTENRHDLSAFEAVINNIPLSSKITDSFELTREACLAIRAVLGPSADLIQDIDDMNFEALQLLYQQYQYLAVFGHYFMGQIPENIKSPSFQEFVIRFLLTDFVFLTRITQKIGGMNMPFKHGAFNKFTGAYKTISYAEAILDIVEKYELFSSNSDDPQNIFVLKNTPGLITIYTHALIVITQVYCSLGEKANAEKSLKMIETFLLSVNETYEKNTFSNEQDVEICEKYRIACHGARETFGTINVPKAFNADLKAIADCFIENNFFTITLDWLPEDLPQTDTIQKINDITTTIKLATQMQSPVIGHNELALVCSTFQYFKFYRDNGEHGLAVYHLLTAWINYIEQIGSEALYAEIVLEALKNHQVSIKKDILSQFKSFTSLEAIEIKLKNDRAKMEVKQKKQQEEIKIKEANAQRSIDDLMKDFSEPKKSKCKNNKSSNKTNKSKNKKNNKKQTTLPKKQVKSNQIAACTTSTTAKSDQSTLPLPKKTSSGSTKKSQNAPQPKVSKSAKRNKKRRQKDKAKKLESAKATAPTTVLVATDQLCTDNATITPIVETPKAMQLDKAPLKLFDNQQYVTNTKLLYHAGVVKAFALIKQHCKQNNLNHEQIYIFGGYVRDQLLNLPYKDVDLVTNLSPSTFLNIFPDFKQNSHHNNLYHFTCDGVDFDLVYEATLNDLKIFSEERVFACNALLASLDGKVYDPLNCINQIRGQALSLVNYQPGSNPFATDCTRILKVIKLASHLGQSIDHLSPLINAAKPQLQTLPHGQMLYLILQLFNRRKGAQNFNLLLELNLLTTLFPAYGVPASYLDPRMLPVQYLYHEFACLDQTPSNPLTDFNALLAYFCLPLLITVAAENNILNLNDERLTRQTAQQFINAHTGPKETWNIEAQVNSVSGYLKDILNRYQNFVLTVQYNQARVFQPLYSSYQGDNNQAPNWHEQPSRMHHRP